MRSLPIPHEGEPSPGYNQVQNQIFNPKTGIMQNGAGSKTDSIVDQSKVKVQKQKAGNKETREIAGRLRH